jgi:transcriptional regulator with XRE-family HTH domain
MPRIYEFTDYKHFVTAWIAEQAKGGRGQFVKLAEASGLHKASISHIFKGEHSLSPEQAHRIALHLGLDAGETSYFLLLVNYGRAGSASLRDFLKKQVEEVRADRAKLSSRVTRSRELSSEERAIFYSNWAYSAIRILSSIPGLKVRDAIFKRLGLSRSFGNQVVEFLVRTGLCVESEGMLGMGPQMTHLEADSPLVSRHHGNWRVKAMERHPMLRPADELAYSAPMSLSEADVLKVRALLSDLVQKVDELVGPSACERLYCLNVDWFEVK